MKMITIKTTFIEESLGLSPAKDDIYEKFIVSNAPDAKTREEEISEKGTDDVIKEGRTIFIKDTDGNPMFYDYQIRGFFKDACSALRRFGDKEDMAKYSNAKDMRAYKKVIDGAIFVYPRHIRINLNGEMGVCERPLRASTAQGERIALASSETVPAGSTMTFQIMCPDKYEKVVKEWLNYGMFKGISQWRNSGKGRFIYDILKIEDTAKPDDYDGRIDRE